MAQVGVAQIGRSDPLAGALTNELQRGERVIWQGKAIARLSPASFGIWLFAIPWTAFALFWTGMAGLFTLFSGEGADNAFDWIFPLFGLPFILVGFGMLGAPFFGPRKARKTMFAITDQRVIRIHVGRQLSVQSLPLGEIGAMERIEARDGSGTLKIELAQSARGSSGTGTSFALGIVDQVALAEARIRELMQRTRRPDADRVSS